MSGGLVGSASGCVARVLCSSFDGCHFLGRWFILDSGGSPSFCERFFAVTVAVISCVCIGREFSCGALGVGGLSDSLWDVADRYHLRTTAERECQELEKDPSQPASAARCVPDGCCLNSVPRPSSRIPWPVQSGFPLYTIHFALLLTRWERTTLDPQPTSSANSFAMVETATQLKVADVGSNPPMLIFNLPPCSQ